MGISKDFTLPEIQKALKRKIAVDRRVRLRALLAIYQLQTMSEKLEANSHVLNGVGFSKYDAEELTLIAEKVKANKPLFRTEEVLLKCKLPKYWRQLVNIAGRNKIEAWLKRAE